MKEKKIEISEKSNVCIQWNTNTIDYSIEEENKIANYFAKKYEIPVNKIRVEPVFKVKDKKGNEVGLNNNTITSIKNPEFQQSLFEPFLKNKGAENYNLEELLKIDNKVNSFVDFDNFNNGKKWTLHWIEWDNFLSFGKGNRFDFSNLNGLIQLNGEPSNESGKSTFACDLIHFLLFGHVNNERAKTMSQMFNNYLVDETVLKVKGCIEIEGMKYIIERILTRPKFNKQKPDVERKPVNTVNYYRLLDGNVEEKLDDENVENLAEESTTKTTIAIREAIGSEEDFDMIISANSKDLDSLISMKDTERGKTLSKWNGLGIIERKEEIAKELYKETKSGRYSDIYKQEKLEGDNELYNEQIKSYNKANEECANKVTEYEEKLKKESKERDDLLQSKKPIDESLNQDVETIENTIKQIINDGKILKAKLEKLNEEYKAYPEDLEEIDKDTIRELKSKWQGLIQENSDIKAEIKTLKKDNETLKNSEYCPVCHKKFDNVDNSKLIEANNNKINELMTHGVENKKEIDRLETEINDCETNNEQYSAKNKLSMNIDNLNKDCEAKRTEYKERLALKKRIEDNKDAIRENNEITTKINLKDATIKEYSDIISKNGQEINTNNYLIKQNKANIQKNNEIIAKIDEETEIEKNWTQYLEIIGKDGITKMVLMESLPKMEMEVNRLLSDCADFNVEITMNEKKDIEFNLIRDNVKTKLSAASGLERTMSALALRVVLGKMSNLSMPPFILLDEVLGTVACENYDKMEKLFNKIKQDYQFILHITHLTQISDWHDNQITIIKKDNVSQIKK